MSAAELIQRMKDKDTERRILLDTLRMWDDLASQGITADEVVSFTLVEEFLNKQQKEEIYRARQYGYPTKFLDGPQLKNVVLYNQVKLKDGTTVQLSPMIRRPTS